MHNFEKLTAVNKQQLLGPDVMLGEVQDVPGGGALQSQVAVAGRCDDKL